MASDIELPGAIPDGRETQADVLIHSGPIPEALGAPIAEAPTWQATATDVLLCIPDIGAFLVRGGEILYSADPGAVAADLAAFLGGPLLALWLNLKGRAVVRASGICVNGKAVLFCGPSGAGKSTLAAALVARGYPLLVDDVCALTLTPRPLAHPDTTSLKLWRQAIRRLRLGPVKGAPVRPSLEKYHVDAAGWGLGPAPIGVVYNLRESRPPHGPGIEAPNVVDATLALRRSAYHSSMVEPLGGRDLYFQMAAAIASAAPVFHLTRPLTFPALPETADQLHRHWAEIGLLEAAA